MKKLDIEKIKRDFPSYEDVLNEELQDEEFQRAYLNATLEEYLEDGDFNEFFKCLERVIKARGSVKSFSEQVGVDRANLYLMFKGDKIPRLDTVCKILKGFGYSLKIA